MIILLLLILISIIKGSNNTYYSNRGGYKPIVESTITSLPPQDSGTGASEV